MGVGSGHRSGVRALAVAGLLLFSATSACGNGSTGSPKATSKPSPRPGLWVGTVTGYAGLGDDLLEVDIGEKYDQEVDMAFVTQLECGGLNFNLDRDTIDNVYSRAVKAYAPIGSQIGVVRQRESDGGKGYDYRNGMVYHVKDGAPDLASPSMNEEVVGLGVAEPDPNVNVLPESYEDTMAETVAQQRTSMPAENFKNWTLVVRAYLDARKVGRGPLGACVAAQLKDRREAAKQEREFRKWAIGTDGKPGTRDDYGGGGSGDFNVPGWLCPTRFC